MRLPRITSHNKYKREVINFGGLNYTKNFSEGDFSEGTAFSHLFFPSLTQRQKLLKHGDFINPSAAGFCGEECVAQEGALYYKGKKVGDLTGGEKQLIFMGMYVVVFPDKVYYNAETEEFGRLFFSESTKGESVTFDSDSVSVPEKFIQTTFQREEMFFLENDILSTYAKVTVTDGELIFSDYAEVLASSIKTGTIFCNDCLANQYRKVTAVEKTDDNIYKISCELATVKNEKVKFFEGLRPGDAVTISGSGISANNKTAILSEVTGNKLTFSAGEFTAATETAEISFERKVPDFTCVCSFQNRLWGCEKNTIYASKLGDPFNFFVYRELSTDSFTVSANTAGDFTACIPYGNCCLFFKENSCFKLFGNRPSNFQLVESFAGGIKSSCQRSLFSSGGRVFYKGVGGVYVFYGGLPQCISDSLGNTEFENAAGGADEKYYYLAADTKNGREMFVYDIEHGLWSQWGKTDIKGFCAWGGKTFALKTDGIYIISSEPDSEETWSVTLHPSNERYYGKKNYSKIFICAELFENAWIKLEISTDGSKFYTAATHHSSRKCHLSIPAAVRGCNELTLRITGRGKCILESVVREFSVS